MRNQPLIGVCLFAAGMLLAWQGGSKIVSNDERSLIFGVSIVAGCAVAVMTLKNWRTGFFLFFVWMLFEDLFRKYMGNGLALFFGKDVLVLLVYFSLFADIRRGRAKRFHPPFLFCLSLFFMLGALQVFNPNSPHILYGLLGFKTYFFYIPLMYVGYALIRNDEDLRRFLVVNVALAGLIGGLGIAQAILGNSFLNPAKLAPELQDMGNLEKSTPISNQLFYLPDSVFVSSGRYDFFLILAFILALGAGGYFLLGNLRGRGIVFPSIGIIGVATLLCGSRGAVMFVLISTVALAVGLLWGAPWRQRRVHRVIKAIRRSVIFGVSAIALLVFLFPHEAGSRIAYYTETLLPNSSAYQLENRTLDYPIQNFHDTFSTVN